MAAGGRPCRGHSSSSVHFPLPKKRARLTLIRFDLDLEHPRSDMKSLRAFVSLCEPIPIGFTLITLIHLDQAGPAWLKPGGKPATRALE